MDLVKPQIVEVPIEQQFLSALKLTTITVSKNETRPRSPYFKPSSLNCSRVMYFDAIQAQPDSSSEDYSSIRICNCGSSSHENIQYYCTKLKECDTNFEYYNVEKYVKEHNLDYLEIKEHKGYETKLLDTRYNISFLCDGILRYEKDGIIKWFILEIKTETEDKGVNRNSADQKHSNQSICYSLSLGINDVIWLYEERNRCVPKSFHTIVTEQQRNELVQKFNYVNACVKNKQPPQKESTVNCRYCCYKKICKELS